MLPRLSTVNSLILAWFGLVAVTACGEEAKPAAAATTDSAATADSVAGGDTSAASDTGPADASGASDAMGDSSPSADAKSDVKADATKAPCKPWDDPVDWNCPADTHCSYDDTDKIACVPNGTHGKAEDCSDGKGCTIGMCVTAQNGNQGCAPHCTTDGHCDSGSCNKIEGKTYSTCDVAKYTACNPMASKCPAGQGCYLITGGFSCLKAGTGISGDKCIGNSECSPGLTCAGASPGGSGLCRKLCNTSPPTGCVDVTTPCSKLTASVGYCEEI